MPFCSHFVLLQKHATLQRFQKCCENGFNAALKLAELCSGISVVRLEAMYRKACESETYFSDGVFESAEEEEFEAPAETPAVDQCMHVLADVQQAKSFADVDRECDADPTTEVVDEDLDLPDRESLMKLTDANGAEEPFCTEAQRSPPRSSLANYLPDTLQDALSLPKTCPWNGLLRFAIRMRHSAGGSDLRFLKNARNCRRASKRLNWFQWLEYARIRFRWGSVDGGCRTVGSPTKCSHAVHPSTKWFVNVCSNIIKNI